MTRDVPVICIDGPSASGKGTVSRIVAKKLGWHMLDSGALYRLVGYAALQRGVDFKDVTALQLIAANLDVRFADDPRRGEVAVFLEENDVSLTIRSEKSGDAASKVAAVPAVRDALLERQRRFQESPGLVADGRDMGTVVFPNAVLKVFITASAEERAKRRHKQLIEKGIGGNLPDLFREISERDKRDTERSAAPLKPAADAVVIDTTHLSIQQVVDEVLMHYRNVPEQRLS